MNDFVHDSTGKKLKRLLFTEEPFEDESFIGYIMRLAELNTIPELGWILKLAGLRQPYDYEYKYSSDLRVDTVPLSMLTGVDEAKLKTLLYLHEQGHRRYIYGNLIIFGQTIQHCFVKREKAKICPACLIEQIYCRKAWELSPITACPIHQCLLIDRCRKCKRSISWARPKINICQCGFDFRKSRIVSLSVKELRLSQYLHQQFGLPHSSQENIFKYPLNTLSLKDLLTLLFFMAAHFAETRDYSGLSLSTCKSNKKIHEHLCQAIEVFDNWTESYYDFIRTWKKHNVGYYINIKQFYITRITLPRRYSEYELFNRMLHNWLFEEQFLFMHEEFQKYLLRFL